jgi:hypothetical protein
LFDFYDATPPVTPGLVCDLYIGNKVTNKTLMKQFHNVF